MREPAYMMRGVVRRDPVYRRRFFSFLCGMEAAKNGVPITDVPERVYYGLYRTDVADWEHGWRSLKIEAVRA